MRIALSKKVRFDVFKRDGFRCQYCGDCPPKVVLEVDHVTPVSKGGSNSMVNLLTACFDCNRGKSAGLLSEIPQTIADRAAVLVEKQEQLAAYEKLLKKIRRQQEARINEVEEVLKASFPGKQFAPKFRESVRTFLEKLDVYKVIGAMSRACDKCSNADQACKYFCGICWTIIREQ